MVSFFMLHSIFSLKSRRLLTTQAAQTLQFQQSAFYLEVRQMRKLDKRLRLIFSAPKGGETEMVTISLN